MTRFPELVPIITLLAVVFAGCSKDSLTIQDAWIPEAPPSVAVLAGYMTIENGSPDHRTLVGATGASFQRVEIHRTIHDRETGLARMSREEQVTVGPGETVVFEPGGYHLMLIHPGTALQEGQKVPLTLAFSQGPGLEVEFEVRRTRLRL